MATKVTALDRINVMDNDDLFYIVYDVDGTPVSRGMIKDDVKKVLGINTITGTRVLSGRMIWVSGLTYESFDLTYEINGEQFVIANGTQVTLDAAPTTATFQRIDLIYGDDTGALGISKGTESATPTANTLDTTQIQLTLALLDTNATEPDGVSNEDVYLENTEWTTSVNGSVDADDTSNPQTGTKSIFFDNASNGAYVLLDNGSDFTVSSSDFIVFSIYLINSLNGFAIVTTNTANPSGYSLAVINNNYGFKKNITGSWQKVVVPMSDLGFNLTAVDTFKILNYLTGQSFYIDDIYIQKGNETTLPISMVASDVSLDTTNFDTNLDSTVTNVQKLADAVDELTLGTGGNLEYQTEITVNTTLDGTQKGLNKVYPVNSTTSKTITITTGDYVLNDVINIERRGQGTVEILADTGVYIRGVRDIDNRYFINDVNSLVSLICRGSEEFAIIGNLTRGYTGAVTTSSYTSLVDGGGAQDITVIGTGFSANMKDPLLTGNATYNSWTFINNNQITINATPTGAVSDNITVTYDNGDVFVDTDAITITDSLAYDTANLRHYYPLSANSNDAVISGSINGTDTSITYTSGYAIFNGTTSKVVLADDDSLSWGNGTTDADLSISFTVNADVFAGHILGKFGAGTNGEYRIAFSSSTNLKIQCRDVSVSTTITADYDISGWSTGTDYHCILTKTGTSHTGYKLYVNGSLVSISTSSVGTYTAMENTTADLILGNQGTEADYFDGKLRRIGLWNVELDSLAVTDIYAEEVTNDNDLL